MLKCRHNKHNQSDFRANSTVGRVTWTDSIFCRLFTQIGLAYHDLGDTWNKNCDPITCQLIMTKPLEHEIRVQPSHNKQLSYLVATLFCD